MRHRSGQKEPRLLLTDFVAEKYKDTCEELKRAEKLFSGFLVGSAAGKEAKDQKEAKHAALLDVLAKIVSDPLLSRLDAIRTTVNSSLESGRIAAGIFKMVIERIQAAQNDAASGRLIRLRELGDSLEQATQEQAKLAIDNLSPFKSMDFTNGTAVRHDFMTATKEVVCVCLLRAPPVEFQFSILKFGCSFNFRNLCFEL